MIKVFLIDDQPATRAVLRLRLELEADLVVVGESGNDHDTVTQVRALAPDVVILDAVTIMLDMGPASALLRELALGWVVVVLSLHDDAATRGRALAAGARHVVSKHGTDGLLLAAIRAAAVPRPPSGSAL
jgi:two-component system, NarL family, nitrate/nitrite response regulator NarP